MAISRALYSLLDQLEHMKAGEQRDKMVEQLYELLDDPDVQRAITMSRGYGYKQAILKRLDKLK